MFKTSIRSYAIGWNDTAEGYKDLFSRNEDPHDYTKRVINALYGKSVRYDYYLKGASDCVKWFKDNLSIPPRLSYEDPDFDSHSVSGDIPAKEMFEKMKGESR